MNPLTQVKRTQVINQKEAALGLSEDASWHAKFKDSAYVFVGGVPYDLTEGDLLAVFAQYGEVVDVNLVRDKATGKSKGFAFVAYEDQRSTVLAVDNLNGAKVLGRIIRVDHVDKYKKEEEEDEDELQKKREERGVCYAFQKGVCAMLSRKASATAEMRADTPMMSREMQTLVGVLRRIATPNGSMTDTVIHQRGSSVASATLSRKANAVVGIPADFRMMSRWPSRLVVSAMLSRKASAIVELPADFHMMREMQMLVGVLRRTGMQDGTRTDTLIHQRAIKNSPQVPLTKGSLTGLKKSRDQRIGKANLQDQRFTETEILW